LNVLRAKPGFFLIAMLAWGLIPMIMTETTLAADQAPLAEAAKDKAEIL
jgi:hypothetical protein